MKIVVRPEGIIEFIYSDEEIKLLELGKATIFRASNVEPEGTKWFADMKNVKGPKLGPFDTRAEALGAEVDWINKYYLTAGVNLNV